MSQTETATTRRQLRNSLRTCSGVALVVRQNLSAFCQVTGRARHRQPAGFVSRFIEPVHYLQGIFTDTLREIACCSRGITVTCGRATPVQPRFPRGLAPCGKN